VEGDERRGQQPSPGVEDAMRAKPVGIARFTNLNRTSVYTAWTFARHGWGVGFATPSAPVDNALLALSRALRLPPGWWRWAWA
jgi:hypothetical protein